MEIVLTDTQQFTITEYVLRHELEEKFGDGDLHSENFRCYKLEYLLKEYRNECMEVINSNCHKKMYLDTQIEIFEEVA